MNLIEELKSTNKKLIVEETNGPCNETIFIIKSKSKILAIGVHVSDLVNNST